ncbi:Long-chain-fatty-acid--CoA ligase FadD15 [Streptomyces hundungensis]|uniref:Long-chain-fatty-acid--CoA ligase FadD15 n=1 Tax=Streptomyces hundungensis TaxID=1077946 RepID=A0A387H914_9ACTN|nr:AMP-binding protein [Streptomyces hundungensis]AYG78673.1 Long-chain-fatty-acid--CoA ligase FadD15 [Streptomyces hundungensis]
MPPPTTPATLAGLSRHGAERWPGAPALLRRDPGGAPHHLTFAEAHEAGEEIARGLMALGLARGDRVAIQSGLRPEWTLTLLAAASCGLVLVSLLPTTVPEEIVHVVNDCGAKAVICEDGEQLAKLRAALPELPGLRHTVVIDEEPGVTDPPMTLADLRTAGLHAVPAAALDRRRASVTPDDLLVIIYTSGTTGPKKGCALSHGNYLAVLRAQPVPPSRALGDADASNGTVFVVTGPHTIALLMQLLSWWSGYTFSSFRGGSPETLPAELRAAAPVIVPLVPLALEMIYRSILADRPASERAELIESARTGLRVRRMRSAGEIVPPRLQEWFDHAEATVFADVRDRFGGNLRRATVAGAPVSPDILSFFVGCGVPLVECYGMTETAAAATSNTPEDNRLGTVGRPLPGVEVAISDTGEVLIRGDHVFRGYWGYDEGEFGAVRDGWLHTGDLGELDQDGFLRLTGRKKELIQLSNGMAVTPHPLERELRAHPLISQAVLYGETKPHLVALLTLDARRAAQWATERGLPTDPRALSTHPLLLEALDKALESANAGLQEYFRAKAFHVLDRELTLENGELTVSMKVARPVVHARFRALYESLYE